MTRRLIAGALLAGLSSSGAQAGPDDIVRRCLQTMGGIEWRMPYAPRVVVQGCGAPGAAWGIGAPAGGSTALELTGTVGFTFDDRPGIGWVEREAAAHRAVYLHFRKLFERHGFALAEEMPYPHNPGHVGTARFERPHEGRVQTLRYEVAASNVWRLTFTP